MQLVNGCYLALEFSHLTYIVLTLSEVVLVCVWVCVCGVFALWCIVSSAV